MNFRGVRSKHLESLWFWGGSGCAPFSTEVAADEGEVGGVPESFSYERLEVFGNVFAAGYAVGDGLFDDGGRYAD